MAKLGSTKMTLGSLPQFLGINEATWDFNMIIRSLLRPFKDTNHAVFEIRRSLNAGKV